GRAHGNRAEIVDFRAREKRRPPTHCQKIRSALNVDRHPDGTTTHSREESMKLPTQVATLLFALAFATEALAQSAKDVTVANTPGNPVPVVSQGTTAVSGAVSINGTPSVNIAGTPSVNIVNPVTVVPQGTTAVSGAVSISGTPSVNIVNSSPLPVAAQGTTTV